jgi:hypothetical protein
VISQVLQSYLRLDADVLRWQVLPAEHLLPDWATIENTILITFQDRFGQRSVVCCLAEILVETASAHHLKWAVWDIFR